MMLPDFILFDQYCVPSPRLGAFCSGICRAEKGAKEKRKWIRGCVKTRRCRSCELVSKCNILCSALHKAAEGLVTYWALVWWCVESEEH